MTVRPSRRLIPVSLITVVLTLAAAVADAGDLLP